VNHPTDKPTLREQLDAVRPDSDDLRDADLHEAARAVEASEQWQQTLARQEAFDRQVAAAMQAVEVPEGLQSRLMAALVDARHQGDESDVDTPQPAEPPQKPPTRRRTILQVAAVAASLLLAIATGWLLLPRDVVQLTLEETRQQIPATDGAIDAATIARLPAFDERNFAFELPDPAWERTSLMVDRLKGLDWTGDGRHDGAIYEFTVGRRVHGYLLVVPASRISDPPASTRLSASNLGYLPVPNTAWVNPTTKLAYICYVDQGDLQTLQRLLYPHAA
jgi:hypothetical protein